MILGSSLGIDTFFSSEKSFEMAHETVKLLANDDLAMIPIRLYLQGVSYLQNCNYDGAVDLCYEFFTQVIFFSTLAFSTHFFQNCFANNR